MSPFTVLLNKALAAPVAATLNALHVSVKNPASPIPEYVAMQILVALIILTLFVLVRLRLSVENPGAGQQFFEVYDDFLRGQCGEVVGPRYNSFVSFLAALGLFILLGNLLGFVPTLESPTGNPAVPLGCALMTFVLYHFQGIKTHGFGYIKQFLGPVWWLAWLMLPIEIFSHLARVLSLTVRLYANMFAGEMVTVAFFSLAPFAVPLPFMALHLLVAFIQAFVFVMLTAVYLGSAMAKEH